MCARLLKLRTAHSRPAQGTRFEKHEQTSEIPTPELVLFSEVGSAALRCAADHPQDSLSGLRNFSWSFAGCWCLLWAQPVSGCPPCPARVPWAAVAVCWYRRRRRAVSSGTLCKFNEAGRRRRAWTLLPGSSPCSTESGVLRLFWARLYPLPFVLVETQTCLFSARL